MDATGAAAGETVCTLQPHQLRGIANERAADLGNLSSNVSEAMKPILAWMTTDPLPEALPELALEKLLVTAAIRPHKIGGESFGGRRSDHAPMDLVASCLLYANPGVLKTMKARRIYLNAIIARYGWWMRLSSLTERSRFLQAVCKIDDALGLTGGRKNGRVRPRRER